MSCCEFHKFFVRNCLVIVSYHEFREYFTKKVLSGSFEASILLPSKNGTAPSKSLCRGGGSAYAGSPPYLHQRQNSRARVSYYWNGALVSWRLYV